jgi:hypothetical protein
MTQPTNKVETEFLMTLHVPLAPAQEMGGGLFIYNALPGGWARGLRIKGEVVQPTADWLRSLPNGTDKLDVRLSILADDGSHIFVSYVGRIAWRKPAEREGRSGAVLGPDDLYFVTAPVFETASRTYAWLNDIVTVGKIVSCKDGEGGFVTYDIFAVT